MNTVRISIPVPAGVNAEDLFNQLMRAVNPVISSLDQDVPVSAYVLNERGEAVF